MVIKLDIWHYMCRFSMACCSESHALYGTFMTQLSGCIFEWDRGCRSTGSCQRATAYWERRLSHRNQDDIANHITKKELANHCKRPTRGSEATAELIQQLTTTFSSDLGKSFYFKVQKRIDLPWIIPHNFVSGRNFPLRPDTQATFHNHIVTFIPGKSTTRNKQEKCVSLSN